MCKIIKVHNIYHLHLRWPDIEIIGDSYIHWLNGYMDAHVRIMTQQVFTLHNKVFLIDMISEPIVIKNGVVVSGHL